MQCSILIFVIEAHFNTNTLYTNVVKQSHARVTLKDIWLLSIILFLWLFPFCLDFVLFHETLLLLRCSINLVENYIKSSRARMNFPVGPFMKFINWGKCVTMAIYAETSKKIDKYFPFAKSNLRKNSLHT